MVDEYTSINEEGTTEGRTNCPDGEIPFKDLERVVGFLVYVSQTYTCMVPYLKGIYLTLNSWRAGQDAMGWKIPKQQRDEAQARDGPAPKFVKCVARLACDVDALMVLTRRPVPPVNAGIKKSR